MKRPRISISKEKAILEKPMRTADTKARMLDISMELRLGREGRRVRRTMGAREAEGVSREAKHQLCAGGRHPWDAGVGRGCTTPCIEFHHAWCSPSKAIDKEPHGKGSNHASNREDGNGEGPERGECGRADGLLVSVQPGTVVEVLNHLQKSGEKGSHRLKLSPFHLCHQCYELPGLSPATYRPLAGECGSQDNASLSWEPPSRWLGSNPREET